MRIVGFSSDQALAERLHEIGHADRIEQLFLDTNDVHRHCLRARTDKGTDCLIALPLDQPLGDGRGLGHSGSSDRRARAGRCECDQSGQICAAVRCACRENF